MVSELKTRNRQIKEKKLLGKDEVYHGALEDILLGELSLNHSQLATKAHPQLYTSVTHIISKPASMAHS